jgi:hypothetical protein
MSMNFGREQSLLRQKLSAGTNATMAAARQQELGTELACLGASDAAVAAAAQDLIAAHPQMGRAQMTAFVRTLWRSRIHELRVVGIELLAARHHLLEPADLPFVEELLRDCRIEPVACRLADAVLGALLLRSKKLWKDLERMAAGKDSMLSHAAIRACRQALLDDAAAFPRFAGVVRRLASTAEPTLWHTIDQVLLAVATQQGEAVRQFAQQHGRELALPTPVLEPTPEIAPAAAAATAAAATAAPANTRVAAAPRPTASTQQKVAKRPATKPAPSPTARRSARSSKAAGSSASSRKTKPATPRRTTKKG